MAVFEVMHTFAHPQSITKLKYQYFAAYTCFVQNKSSQTEVINEGRLC